MKKRIPIVVLLLVAIAAGALWASGKWRPAKTGELRLYGNVDIREVNLGFRVPGRITDVLRDEGDPVKAGEEIARLDPEPYRREADQAEAQVAALKARLDLLVAGHRPEEIAQARATAREREVSFANAERINKRTEELYASRTVSIQERDDADAAYHEAEARLNSAREQLKLQEVGFRQEEIAQARADLAQAEAALAAARLRVDDTVLKSPSDGVVFTRAQEPGAIVQAGTAVLTVSLRQPVWVRAYVDEPNLGKIHPGMKVRIHTDSRAGQPYTGQVGFISPRAEFTPKNVETPELRTSLVYRLRIVVENPDDALRQGMPVTVQVP